MDGKAQNKMRQVRRFDPFKWQIWQLFFYNRHIGHAHALTSVISALCCIPPSSSVHGVLSARILEWIPMSSSRGSARSRDWIWLSYISCIDRCFVCLVVCLFYHWHDLGSHSTNIFVGRGCQKQPPCKPILVDTTNDLFMLRSIIEYY